MAPSSQSNSPLGQQADDLLATQKLLRATLDASMDMIQVFEAVRNQQGEIIDFIWILNNHTSEKIYGDVVGKRLLEFQPGVIEEGIFEAFKQVVETGLPQQYEKQYVHEQFDGWFLQSVVKLNDGVATTTANITPRKRAEEQLQQSQAFLQSVIDSSLDVIQVFKAVRDETGSIVDFVWVMNNQKAVVQNGPVIGKSLLELNPGVLQTGIFDHMIEVAQTGVAYEHEQYYKHEQFDGWFYQALVKTDDGVAMTTRDITQAKLAEGQILRLKEEVAQQATDKYYTIFNSIDEVFLIHEIIRDHTGRAIDFRLMEVNPAFTRQTGLGTDTIGKRASEFLPNLEQFWIDIFDRVARSGIPERVENFNQATHRWYNAHVSRMSGQDRQVAVLFEDITERKQRETGQELLISIAQDLGQLTDETQIVRSVGTRLATHLGITCYHYVDIDEDHDQVTVRHFWHALEVPPLLGTYPLRAFVSPAALADWRAGKPTIIHDIERELPDGTPESTVLKAGAAVHKIRAFIAVGLSHKGKWKAYFALAHSSPRSWTAVEIKMVQEVAGQLLPRIERARTEEALRQSQKRFESIANLVPDLLWDSGPDGSTNWYNQRWLAYTGQRFEEAIGWGWTDAIHPDDREASAKRYSEAVEVGTSLRQEHRIRRHDGAYRWFVVSASPLMDEAGQVVNMYGAATDIHDRKQSEEALSQLEQRNRLAIEAAELATWEWDLVTDQVYWNELHFQLLGMPIESNPQPSETFMSHLHPDDAETIKDQLTQAIAQRTLYNAEFRVVREDGVIRWMSGYGRVTAETDGQPVRVSGVMMDITDRKAAQEALRQSEERQRAILESAKDYAIFTTDLDQQVTSWNPGAQALFGYSEAEILQQSVDRLYNREDRQQNIPHQEAQTAIRVGRFDNERWHSRQDNSLFYGSGVVTPLRNEAGSIVGLLKVMRDLTAQKRAEEALQEADRRKDEFLAMLAHELRNPMSTIRSGLQILSLTQRQDEMSRSTVDMMNRQTDHLVRMVDDLLDVSRISRGKIELKKERINLVEVVHQALEAVHSLYQQSGRQLQASLPTGPIYLEGDATRLTQVVSNLLTNGVRYTGERDQVWLSLKQQDGPSGGQEAILEVGDNGIGIAADQLGAIFELFVQVDTSLARSKGGLGLGLTLVKRLVEMHGGRVEAQSEGLGQGSTFTVHLPTLTSAVEPTAQPAPQPGEPAAAQRILVIDDNADAGFTLAMLLKLKGYEAHSRTSGRAGLEAADQLQPAAILLDIGMPELDGYATCRLLRQQSWGQDLVVIALTGYGQEEDQQRTREAGFDGHLVKPVDLEVLANLLTNLLDKGTNR